MQNRMSRDRDRPLSAADVMRLQRSIGNHAVQRMLIARQADEPSAGVLLSPQQVTKALGYYAKRPRDYTEAIIGQIQTEIGTSVTGRMMEVDVQAIAGRQQAMNDAGEQPALKIDGIAGPRTLPSIFKRGLAEDDSLNAYSDQVRQTITEYEDIDREELVQMLGLALSQQLEARGVPPIQVLLGENDGIDKAEFSEHGWVITVSEPLHKYNLRETAASIYHAGRHAEQCFRMAQLLAARGYTPAQIREEISLNIDIAEIAHQRPAQPGSMEALIAKGWLDNNRQYQNGRDEMRMASAELAAAEQANLEEPSPENQARVDAAHARHDAAVEKFSEMPAEFDGLRVEARVYDHIGMTGN